VAGKGPPFAPLPLRALADSRLAALHLRALGIIAYHDRMSLVTGKGQGCWASLATMAGLIGCNLTNLSTAINELARWGYLEVGKRQDDKRLKVYRVVFEADEGLPEGKSSAPVEPLPLGKASARTDLPSEERPSEVVCPPSHAAPQKTAKNDSQYISQSEGIHSAEADEINSAEAGAADASPERHSFYDRTLDMNHDVGVVFDSLQEGRREGFVAGTGATVDQVSDWLEGSGGLPFDVQCALWRKTSKPIYTGLKASW
jgi:hypothetical protein